MREKRAERVSVGLPEVVQAFGALQKTLLETLIASDAISAGAAKRVFHNTYDQLLDADAKGAAAVLELMHKQMNWEDFSPTSTIVRKTSQR